MGPEIQILNAPKLPQETELGETVAVGKKDKLPTGRRGKQIQSVEEVTGVKVTLTLNTGVNLARAECFMKTFLCLNAEHFHPASIKNQRGAKQKGFTEASLMRCSLPGRRR